MLRYKNGSSYSVKIGRVLVPIVLITYITEIPGGGRKGLHSTFILRMHEMKPVMLARNGPRYGSLDTRKKMASDVTSRDKNSNNFNDHCTREGEVCGRQLVTRHRLIERILHKWLCASSITVRILYLILRAAAYLMYFCMFYSNNSIFSEL